MIYARILKFLRSLLGSSSHDEVLADTPHCPADRHDWRLESGAAPGLVTARMDANRSLGNGAAPKSCIFILLCGGPSHLDTWDLKPDAPEGIRGPYADRHRGPRHAISASCTRALAPLAQHFASSGR